MFDVSGKAGFSSSEESANVWSDVRNGILKDFESADFDSASASASASASSSAVRYVGGSSASAGASAGASAELSKMVRDLQRRQESQYRDLSLRLQQQAAKQVQMMSMYCLFRSPCNAINRSNFGDLSIFCIAERDSESDVQHAKADPESDERTRILVQAAQ